MVIIISKVPVILLRKKLKPSNRGELEITDLLNEYRKKRNLRKALVIYILFMSKPQSYLAMFFHKKSPIFAACPLWRDACIFSPSACFPRLVLKKK